MQEAGTIGSKNRIAIYLAALFLISLFQYAYSLNNDFVWDSRDDFLNDSSIRDLQHLPGFFVEDFWSYIPREGSLETAKYYRPIIKAIHLAEYHVFGADPRGYNAASIILNAAVVLFGFQYIVIVTKNSRAAFLAALLFAVNPVRVEAVSWAHSDTYLVVALFSLGALILYAKERYVWSLAAYMLALLSHESAITLPGIVVLYELFIRRERQFKELLRRSWLFVPATIVYLILRRAVLGALPITSLDPLALANTIAVIVKRSVKMFFLTDAPITVYPKEHFPFLSFEVLVSYAVVAVLLALGVYLWRRRKDLFFWYAWFFVSISIMFNVGQVGDYLMSDKLLNFASLGFCAFIALAVESAVQWRKEALVFVAVLAAFYSGSTFSHLRFWKNDTAYFDKALESAPGFYLLHYIRAGLYASEKDYDSAILEYERTIQLNPRYSYAYSNLGSAKNVKGDVVGALAAWDKASWADPANPVPYYNIGMVLEQRGELRGASRMYQRYLQLAPDAPEQERMRIQNVFEKLGEKK